MKVVTLNLRHDANQWEARLPLIVAGLAEADADVIGFQEVVLDIGQAERIAEGLNVGAERPYTVKLSELMSGDGYMGNAILSRLALMNYDEMQLPIKKKVAQRFTVEWEGHSIHIAHTHLYHGPIYSEEIRLPQMEALLAWLFERSERGWILFGDMNAQPQSKTILEATKYFDSAFPTVHGAHPITFPTPLVAELYPRGLAVTPDHIFFDAETYVAEGAWRVGTEPHPENAYLYASDHFGVGARFGVRG
jgi:endonuclease/exonuclease/phosphatase family metal-dependent hydrolase